jgi:hypothetical protein
MAEAARLLLRTITQEPKPTPTKTASPSDPLLGIWQDAPDEIDEIVAEAMQRRREEPWRALPRCSVWVRKSLVLGLAPWIYSYV